MSSTRPPAFRTPFALIPTLLLGGCGHPASVAECDELFAKTAEIALRQQNIVEPHTVAGTASRLLASSKVRCLGSSASANGSNRSLACVRRATTAEEFDRCL